MALFQVSPACLSVRRAPRIGPCVNDDTIGTSVSRPGECPPRRALVADVRKRSGAGTLQFGLIPEVFDSLDSGWSGGEQGGGGGGGWGGGCGRGTAAVGLEDCTVAGSARGLRR